MSLRNPGTWIPKLGAGVTATTGTGPLRATLDGLVPDGDAGYVQLMGVTQPDMSFDLGQWYMVFQVTLYHYEGYPGLEQYEADRYVRTVP